MKDEDIASLFAGQTAAIVILIEELIENQAIERKQIVRRYYDALEALSETRDDNRKGAAIRHIISVIENDDVTG